MNILGVKYKYKEVDDLPGKYGTCDWYHKEIIVLKKCPQQDVLFTSKETKKITQIHEFIHAVANEAGWDMIINAELLDTICETIAKQEVKNFNVTLKKQNK